MKILKNIIPVLAITFSLGACSDFLEPVSESNFDESYVFSNTGDAKKMVLGVYALFSQDSYTSRMSNVWLQNSDVEVTAPSAQPDGSRRDVWSLQGGLLTGFKDIKTAWDDNYKAIDRANQCIEGIQKSAIASDPEMKMMLGESYCLRAYRYFLLINYWGDVPYFRDAANASMQLDIPKTDKNIIYSGLIQDLVNSEEDMYFADEFSDGIERMNREFAMGMISRLALFRAGYGTTANGTMKRADEYLNVAGNDSLAVTYTYKGVTKTARTYKEYYQLASDYAEKLIELKDRALTDYATVFMNENKWVKPTNSDVLYEIAFGNTNGGGDVGWCIGVPVTGTNPYGNTTIQVGFTPTYYYSFDRKDLRRDVTITKIGYGNDPDINITNFTQNPLGIVTMAVGKWNRLELNTAPGANSSKGTGINWPVMRYSDVLLMYAEAQNELNEGPNAIAKQLLKRVRARAFDAGEIASKVDAYVDSISGDKQSFFDAIVNERAWEFGGEGLRKFDLGRWNIFGKKIVETKQILDYIGQVANGLPCASPDSAKYATYAKKLYYQKINNKIVWLNDFENPAIVPENITTAENVGKAGFETAYASINWCQSLYKKITPTDGSEVYYTTADYTDRCWRGYTDPTGISAVPYLLPISSQTAATSIYLNNDGYGLVTSN